MKWWLVDEAKAMMPLRLCLPTVGIPTAGIPTSKDKSRVARGPFYVIPSDKNRQLATANNSKMSQIGVIGTIKSPTDRIISGENETRMSKLI